jgi:hypothetical protein
MLKNDRTHLQTGSIGMKDIENRKAAFQNYADAMRVFGAGPQGRFASIGAMETRRFRLAAGTPSTRPVRRTRNCFFEKCILTPLLAGKALRKYIEVFAHIRSCGEVRFCAKCS